MQYSSRARSITLLDAEINSLANLTRARVDSDLPPKRSKATGNSFLTLSRRWISTSRSYFSGRTGTSHLTRTMGSANSMSTAVGGIALPRPNASLWMMDSGLILTTEAAVAAPQVRSTLFDSSTICSSASDRTRSMTRSTDSSMYPWLLSANSLTTSSSFGCICLTKRMPD